MAVGRLEGKVAVITGGASGIGAGTVRRFVGEGARCVVADIQAEAGQALADELGDAAIFRRTDVTVEDDVRAAVELAVARFGRIDCMINNAGIVGATGSITDLAIQAWNDTVSVLLTSVFLGMKHAGAAMVHQGDGGSIISLSSTAGVIGGVGPHVYTAAKHGVVGLTKSVANELAPHGIRVNAIAPGNTVTAMTASVITGDHADLERTAELIGAGSPLGYPGMPIDIANAALFLASDESRYVSGHILVVDAGQTSAGMKPSPMHRRSQMIREGGRRS
jgi:NAD(P)-dependent dehydrogenase (short-subunit alcohol dehydrogenase family)